VRGDLPHPAFLDDRWPAHLHINLLPAGRGQGLGTELVHRWLATLRSDGVPGCHLETWAENADASAFFEAMGFTRRGEPTLMPGFRSRTGGRHHLQLMVQSLSLEPDR
jgi:RimJ/RimL family protein N-acetyltransferase